MIVSPGKRQDHGRSARRPSEIPPRGWLDVLWRIWRGVTEDSLLMVARSIAFSGVMALLPGLAAFIALYGLFADPSTAVDHLSHLRGVLPPSVLALVGDEMVRISVQAEASLSLAFVAGLLVALWTANTGMRALIRGLNIAYSEPEHRSLVRLTLTSLAMTAAGFLLLLTTAAALVVSPVLIRGVGLPTEFLPLSWLRWPAVALFAVLVFQLLYRFAPSRTPARWTWLSWGAALASALWIGGSIALSAYVTAFDSFAATYGSLAAVFGFLIWSWLSAAFVLLGAKLNAELEHQTTFDTTIAPDRPMGQRGAVVADTLGAPYGCARRGDGDSAADPRL